MGGGAAGGRASGRRPAAAGARVRSVDARARRGRSWTARVGAHDAEVAKSIVGRAGSSRSWLGAHASAALGCVSAAEGRLAEAERELATVERFFRERSRRSTTPGSSSSSPASAVVAAGSMRPGRRLPRRERRSASSGTADKSHRSRTTSNGSSRARAAGPGTARSSIRRAGPSWRSCSCSPATSRPARSPGSSSSRPTRSGPIPARSTASSPSTPGPMPSPAPTRWDCSGKRNHPCDRTVSGVARVVDRAMLVHGSSGMAAHRRRRAQRPHRQAFAGMALIHQRGNTVLVGPVRDQAELQATSSA